MVNGIVAICTAGPIMLIAICIIGPIMLIIDVGP
ncbi:Uncharacterised protein [Mycobacteroides abscessus subsp. bolletii]|nr:Uncharacterised protein [Mycobacteroides abscessus subsp. bolletii]SKW70735.1 Uncharacterised protein [Mycobacteroides abscessus subsp. bolletii]